MGTSEEAYGDLSGGIETSREVLPGTQKYFSANYPAGPGEMGNDFKTDISLFPN